jgi:hypothetical protein
MASGIVGVEELPLVEIAFRHKNSVSRSEWPMTGWREAWLGFIDGTFGNGDSA